MKEHGILFSDEMIRSYRAGRKGMTRRARNLDQVNINPGNWQFLGMVERNGGYCFHFSSHGGRIEHFPKSPYGRPGDSLWFREAWTTDAITMYPAPPAWYRATDGDTLKSGESHSCPPASRGRYADCLACWEDNHGKFRWKPSMFMPRNLCRHVTPLLSVRAERLHDIIELDAIAEGIEQHHSPVYPDQAWWKLYGTSDIAHLSPVESFKSLWESINGAGSWEKNPWVGVYEFEKFKP